MTEITYALTSVSSASQNDNLCAIRCKIILLKASSNQLTTLSFQTTLYRIQLTKEEGKLV